MGWQVYVSRRVFFCLQAVHGPFDAAGKPKLDFWRGRLLGLERGTAATNKKLEAAVLATLQMVLQELPAQVSLKSWKPWIIFAGPTF
jgi:hypothetical protein